MERTVTSVHPYSSINLKRKDQTQILYDRVDLPWGKIQDYSISKKIGRGKYSHVFEGRNLNNNQKVVIKVLLPVKPHKIKRQYHIHQSLKHPSIPKIIDIVKCPSLRTASFILQHVEHDDFRQIYHKFNLEQIKHYGRLLFEGLDYIHSQGIMHRDIKPFNVLINRQRKNLKIIDFGLSQYYHPSADNNTKVGSLYYKAPQLYFSNPQYDYRVDCWSAGLILAGMIFKKTPFLIGNDNIDQILKLTKLVGIKQVVNYINQYRLITKGKKDSICHDIVAAYENGDIKVEHSSDLTQFINPQNKETATPQALDLLRRLLMLDYKKRLTAKNALQHAFFK